MMTHRYSYTKLYGTKENYDVILNVLIPCVSYSALFKKWIRLPKMGHPITIAYDRACIDLTRYGFSKIFFPLRSRPPQNRSRWIMCIGFLSKTQYFIHVYLKLGFPIPKTSSKWMTYFTHVETWLDHFLKRMEGFT